MPRPMSFSPDEALRLAAQAFIAGGYEATSVDDLVQALNLHRGSLYKAFGSKRGLFLAVLEQYVVSALPAAIRAATSSAAGVLEELANGTDLDLLLIAAVERGHRDEQVAGLIHRALHQLQTVAGQQMSELGFVGAEGLATAILGARLGRRLLPEPIKATTTMTEESPHGSSQH